MRTSPSPRLRPLVSRLPAVPAAVLLLSAALLAGVTAVGAPAARAVAVPMPVEVRPGGAEADGVVAWAPPLQVVEGPRGGTVGVDLALDDGTSHPVTAALSVHTLTTDDDGELVPGRQSSLVTLGTGRVALQPGDRGLLAATASVPATPTLVAVRAELLDARTPAAPLAILLLRPDDHAGGPGDLAVEIDDAGGLDDAADGGAADGGAADGGAADGGAADGGVAVVVRNEGDADAVVDLAARTGSWLGRDDHHEATGIAVPAGTSRRIRVPTSTGLGRRTIEVVAAARGGPTVRASLATWTGRTLPVTVAVVLVVSVGAATAVVLRRRRRASSG